jgi:hypothetical protein
MVTSVTKGRTQTLPKLRLLKPTDMTILWKALDEHFLISVSIQPISGGKMNFSEFFSKISVLIQYMRNGLNTAGCP